MILEALRATVPGWIKKKVPGPLKRWLRAGIRPRPTVNTPRRTFSEVATEDDVYFCYRILLGRPPDPDGWKAYSASVREGEMNLETLASHFLSSAEFRARRRSRSQSEPVLVDLGEFRMYVSLNDFNVGRAIWKDRTYEPHVTAVLREHLGPGRMFVDVGANVGYFSLLAASIVGATGRVASFEPLQANSSLLLLSARLNDFANIDLYPFAAAERRRTLLVHGEGSHATVSELEARMDLGPSGTAVVSLTLDEALREAGRIDVIKLDIEGAEALALEGARALVRTHRPIIVSEFSPAALRNVSHLSGDDYLRQIIREGYDLVVLGEEGHSIRCGSDIQRVMRMLGQAAAPHVDLVAYPIVGVI